MKNHYKCLKQFIEQTFWLDGFSQNPYNKAKTEAENVAKFANKIVIAVKRGKLAPKDAHTNGNQAQKLIQNSRKVSKFEGTANFCAFVFTFCNNISRTSSKTD